MCKEDMLAKAKTLLAVTGEAKDEIIELLIEDAINLVLGYCRIKHLPEGLESLIPFMVADRYRMSGYGSEQGDSVIKSITQGSVSNSYGSRSEMFSNHFLNNYKHRVFPYINRKGRVPSDFDRPRHAD